MTTGVNRFNGYLREHGDQCVEARTNLNTLFKGQIHGAPTIPLVARMAILNSRDAQANKSSFAASQSKVIQGTHVRVSNIVFGVLLMPLNLAYRITRAVLRTVFAPITVTYAYYDQKELSGGVNAYKMWKEDLKSIGAEWVDVGTTLLALPVGLVNAIYPTAIKMNWLADYYIARTDHEIQFDQALRGSRATATS